MQLITSTYKPSSSGQRWKIQWQGGFGVHHIRSSADTSYFVCIKDNSIAAGATLILNRKSSPEGKYFMFQPTSYLDKEVTNWFRSTTGWIAGDGRSEEHTSELQSL